MNKVFTRFRRLEIIAFTSGFALMAFELVAARLLAPTVGSSTYVWTSVIGVIIAALSLGYWFGGRVADQRHRHIDVALISLVAAAALVIMLIVQEPFLSWLAGGIGDARVQGLLASLFLFAPTSFLLGMLSPYLVKLNVTSLDTSGRSVASLSALNSIGGIAGTFTTGFVLFGVLGSQAALFVVLLLIILPSWLIAPRQYTVSRLIVSGVLIGVTGLSVISPRDTAAINIDTPSAHYQVIDFVYGGRYAKGLVTGPTGIQSAIYSDQSDELVFWYTREAARLAELRRPNSVLILGGGSFTLPQYLAQKYDTMNIDVVEIDPALESIATQHFNYQHPDNVQLHFTDARNYLARSEKKYDMIVVDVYGDTSIPFQLLSRQYGAQAAGRLHKDGVLVANVITSRSGECSKLLEAVNGSYKAALPHAQYSSEVTNASSRANHIIAYTKDDTPISGMQQLDMNHSISYNDDFVPAERMHQQCLDSRT